MVGTVAFVFIALVVILLASGVRVLYQYQQGVVFTLGRYTSTIGPGIRLVIPILQTMVRVDMRVRTINVPKQEVITKDNISIGVNASVYYKINSAKDVIIKVDGHTYVLASYVQAVLKDIVGEFDLDVLLSKRDEVSNAIQQSMVAYVEDWGLLIDSVKIQEIELTAELKRAMARQAEAERERRALITVSEGEFESSVNLSKAARIMSETPGALELRTLQTIREIAAEPSQKIIIPVPFDISKVINNVSGK